MAPQAEHIRRDCLRFQNGTSEEVCEKECLRSQFVTSEETKLAITNCDFKIKSRRKEPNYERKQS